MGIVSIFMSNSGKEHCEGVNRMLCYLKSTFEADLCFIRMKVVLEGFASRYLGGCAYSRKSTFYMFTVGGVAICWMSI